MTHSETWNLYFSVKVDNRNRIQIPKDVATRAKLKAGDLCSFVLTQIVRKEA